MNCNKCGEEGVKNSAGGNEFWYCRTCKDEIYTSKPPVKKADNYVLKDSDIVPRRLGISFPVPHTPVPIPPGATPGTLIPFSPPPLLPGPWILPYSAVSSYGPKGPATEYKLGPIDPGTYEISFDPMKGMRVRQVPPVGLPTWFIIPHVRSYVIGTGYDDVRLVPVNLYTGKGSNPNSTSSGTINSQPLTGSQPTGGYTGVGTINNGSPPPRTGTQLDLLEEADDALFNQAALDWMTYGTSVWKYTYET